VHSHVRLKFVFATDPDIKGLGDVLDDLGRLRNRANYILSSLPEFADATEALRSIDKAADAIALLDAIEADPARLAAAQASIQP
jgi:hypothetical protein